MTTASAVLPDLVFLMQRQLNYCKECRHNLSKEGNPARIAGHHQRYGLSAVPVVPLSKLAPSIALSRTSLADLASSSFILMASSSGFNVLSGDAGNWIQVFINDEGCLIVVHTTAPAHARGATIVSADAAGSSHLMVAREGKCYSLACASNDGRREVGTAGCWVDFQTEDAAAAVAQCAAYHFLAVT
ncbi:hypothetical protein B0T17DRAFT_599740 [Bombardia bombarda]|uniref:Uncharacterized protein n=1 Tax=Bombardia bombarda TaxID=252184 RepID=A0AA40C4W4_9PEZI|nr:hypothetical protein B0T17DRAFT_599740 [Bombardia bombarda]